MKRLLLLSTFFITFSSAFAQYYYVAYLYNPGNPGGLNNDDEYPVGGGLAATWTPIAPTGNVVAWSATQTLPFSFSFNGNAVTGFKASTTGVVTFDVSAVNVPSANNTSLPSSVIPDNSIMAWGIQSMGINDNICTKVFGTAPNRQLWILYTSYSNNNDSTHYVYWSIVLEETSNNIYIVDERNLYQDQDLTIGIQMDQSTALEVTGSPLIDGVAAGDATPADNNYYQFVNGTQPSLNMTAFDITMAPYQALPAAPFTVTGSLFNEGATTITSFDINYSIDSGSAVTSTLSGLSIPAGTTYYFSHPTTWSPVTAADYEVTVWASNLNGGADQDQSDDQYSTTIHVVPEMTQMTPTFEEFTSSTCGPCAANNPIFDPLLEDNWGLFTCIKYQMNWPGSGDPYYNNDGETRRAYYGVTAIPDLFVNGTELGAPAYFTQDMFDEEYAKPSFMSINATYSITGNVVSVNSTITPLIDFTGTIKAYIAVVEEPTYNNVETNGETEFHFVEQKMLSSGSGTTLTGLTANSAKTLSKAYSFPGSSNVEDFSHLLVAEWVQNLTTHEIYQSTFATLTTGQQEIENVSSGIIKLYPNPANDQSEVFIQLEKDDQVSVHVVNYLGQEVYSENLGMMQHGRHQVNLLTTDWNSGSYFVEVMIGKNVYRANLIVMN